MFNPPPPYGEDLPPTTVCDNLCGSGEDTDWQVSIVPFGAEGTGAGTEPVRYHFCSVGCMVEFLDTTG